MNKIPEANVRATVYEVCCLPVEWQSRRHFTVTVEHRGEDRWAVLADGFCFDADRQRCYEGLSSNRSPDFLRRYRFTLEDALALAKRIAPTLKVGRYTVADALVNGPEWL